MAKPQFKPGDKVQNLGRSAVVLEVVSVDGERVRCVTHETFPATGWGTPERTVPLYWNERALFLTRYNPAPLPKLEPIVLDLRTPNMSEVDKLELFYDGRIPAGELERARRIDRARAAERAAALLASDGERLPVAAE